MKVIDGILTEFKNEDIGVNIVFPDKVSSIGKEAFAGCTGLTTGWLLPVRRVMYITKLHLDLPDGVTSIGKRAFYNCRGLTSITLPEGLNSIGKGAFNGCTGLAALTLPEGLNSIGECAFDGCTNLKQVLINTDDRTKYNQIKALLPAELQKVVFDFAYLEPIRQIHSQCLQRLVNCPATNLLYQELLFGGCHNPFFGRLPKEIMVEINNQMKDGNWYYDKAKKELNALGMPKSFSEEELENHRQACEAIVSKVLNKAINRANVFAVHADKKETIELQKSQLITELNKYINDRRIEAGKNNLGSHYSSFFGRIFGSNALDKINAAEKEIMRLKNEPIAAFTKNERKASRSNRLGDILAKYPLLVDNKSPTQQIANHSLPLK